VKLLDSNGNVVSTATTDANGNYLFKDLVPGNYSVQVVAPAGTSFTGKDLGGNDTTDSDVIAPASPASSTSSPVKPTAPWMPA
jgi:uncharacterized protein YfaS (alpha-2-macroglobulin family)